VKIAIIRKKYTFHGGAESFSSSLIKHLADKDHEIHIFAIKWETDKQYKNIYFHKVPAITFISFLRDFSFALSSYYLLKKQKNRFDIIQTHDKTLFQDIYRAGDGCHIEWLKQRWKRLGLAGRVSIILNPYHWLILGLERSIFKKHRFKKIIAISRLVKDNIMDNYRVPSADIEVIYNGVDLERFHPDNRKKYRNEIRQKYGLTGDDFVVLFVGSGFERKGVKYLIEAVESISKPLTLMIVGKGSGKRFKKPPHPVPLPNGERGRRIIFCGPQKEIYKYYAAADVFVFPTIYEPFGNVHLEALASGLPVITTKNSGASEIIENGKQGFVIENPEGIIEEIVERIIHIMDRNVNQRMSVEARKLAESFSFEKHIQKMHELYNTIT
jgi:UDP-glucose:(heptosyl)LPS alpha-1,3-glucosyltransferase